MKNPLDVILRPVLTEASYDGFADKRYVFEVHPTANKTEIKLAQESIFKGIKVDKVNTLRTLGKMKRQGRTAGRTPEIKKAYVTLTKDSKSIEFFEGMAELSREDKNQWLFEFISRPRPLAALCRC